MAMNERQLKVAIGSLLHDIGKVIYRTGLDSRSHSESGYDFVKNELGIDLPEGYISNTKYWLIDNNEYIGSFTLRHDVNENLMKWGGHIGYIVAPSKRGHGYAFAGLKLVLAEAAKLGLKRVLITCNTENNASFAVINKAKEIYGGEQLEDSHLEGFSEHRVWINTSK